jgi:tRNA threonylcarbamoyladenosine biosynthesis protein TsaB
MQLCIDAADDHPGVALAIDGVVAHSHTWETQQNHSKELLPNIYRLLAETNRMKSDITAVFVDIGPGGYAALRVGVSIAKGLAHGLSVPIVGIGRLELDAWRAAEAAKQDARYIAVHTAGRGELAWAAYARHAASWREAVEPRITKVDDMVAALAPGDVVTGDVDDALADAIKSARATVALPASHRVIALAALGHQRLTTGALDAAEALVPMYLRAPAIGPQR